MKFIGIREPYMTAVYHSNSTLCMSCLLKVNIRYVITLLILFGIGMHICEME